MTTTSQGQLTLHVIDNKEQNNINTTTSRPPSEDCYGNTPFQNTSTLSLAFSVGITVHLEKPSIYLLPL